MSSILAIDPGTTKSGWAIYDPYTHRVLDHDITDNHLLLEWLDETSESVGFYRKLGDHDYFETLAIEMVASMGMAVGAEVFETCVWIGMFMHAWECYEQVRRITRNQVKMHLCGSVSAKDANVRQAIIDRFPAAGGGATPQIGTKKQPGPLFGVSTHIWPALGVALTAAHMEEKEDEAARLADVRPASGGRARVRL